MRLLLTAAFTLAFAVAQNQPSQLPQVIAPEPAHWYDRLGMPYAPVQVHPASFANSPRLEGLIRAGNLYLSLQDTIALAIENNLDIEYLRFAPRISETELLRARGGGTLRGVPLTASEVPAGIGGPGSPLLNVSATGSAPLSTNVVTSVSDTFPLTGGTTNLSIVAVPLSSGAPVPLYDPAITGQVMWARQAMPEANPLVAGSSALETSSVNGLLGLSQSFSPGTQVSINANSLYQNTNSTRLIYNPYTTSSLALNVVQPLLRGFGSRINRRYIRIAKNEQRMSDLTFRQQVISTVDGVIRLYYDLVSLNEDLRVRRQTLALAQRLYEDNKTRVEAGTLATIELTRAQAYIAAATQDLANSDGYVKQQELILKSVLTRRLTDPLVAGIRIIPTDAITVPDRDEVRPVQDLIAQAARNRPELESAHLQIENSNISLEGSRNELLPEVNLVGSAGSAGLSGYPNPAFASSGLVGGQPGIDIGNVGSPWTSLGQLFGGTYPVYSAGVQLVLPLRNRIAQADYARDLVTVRQAEVRSQQLENQVRLEVESALVVLQRSRAALDAAVQSRVLQEQSLEIEQEKYDVGLSTNYLILQYQSYVAQARSTEVAARGTYVKAREALERAIGETLENHNISIEEAYRGVVR
jgi:outer membrane protein TolC